jgi:hypothetical protein
VLTFAAEAIASADFKCESGLRMEKDGGSSGSCRERAPRGKIDSRWAGGLAPEAGVQYVAYSTVGRLVKGGKIEG